MENKSWQNALSGSIAGLLTRSIIAPLDVIKIRQQLEPTATGKYNTVYQSISCILKEEGPRGFWKGNLPASYLYLSYGGIQFYVYYEFSKWNQFLVGALSSGIATTLTYPFDLVRTRFAVIDSKDRIYKGLAESFCIILKEEGLKGFYRGLFPSLLTVMPSMGLLFYSRSYLLSTFQHYELESLNFSSGFLSGIFTKSVLYPVDTIRKRLQIQGPHRNRFILEIPKYTSSVNVAYQMMMHEGILSLYKGIIPSLLKTGLSSGITFMLVDYIRDLLKYM
jgi:solute carrier family 25 thiamine pyrophosphate transporter 19